MESKKTTDGVLPKLTPSEIAAKLPSDVIIVGEKFAVGRSLGEGSFGKICLGTNIENGEYVAIKIVSTPPLNS